MMFFTSNPCHDLLDSVAARFASPVFSSASGVGFTSDEYHDFLDKIAACVSARPALCEAATYLFVVCPLLILCWTYSVYCRERERADGEEDLDLDLEENWLVAEADSAPEFETRITDVSTMGVVDRWRLFLSFVGIPYVLHEHGMDGEEELTELTEFLETNHTII